MPIEARPTWLLWVVAAHVRLVPHRGHRTACLHKFRVGGSSSGSLRGVRVADLSGPVRSCALLWCAAGGPACVYILAAACQACTLGPEAPKPVPRADLENSKNSVERKLSPSEYIARNLARPRICENLRSLARLPVRSSGRVACMMDASIAMPAIADTTRDDVLGVPMAINRDAMLATCACSAESVQRAARDWPRRPINNGTARVFHHCPGLPQKVPNDTPCKKSPKHQWDPSKWAVTGGASARPATTPEMLRRLCKGLALHVATPAWRPILAKPQAYVRLFDISPNNRTRTDRERCFQALDAFVPRICTLDRVFATSSAKRMFSHDAYFVPGRSSRDLTASRDCGALNRVVGCTGHVAIGRSSFGLAYYHTMYDTLGSLAYILEHVRTSAGQIKILENKCNSDHDMIVKLKYNFSSLGSCHNGMPRFFREMLDFLGLNATSDVHHYPYGRHLHGSSLFLESAVFDCSRASSYRDFWHIVKLRALMQARFHNPSPLQRVLIVINRNTCPDPTGINCPWKGRSVIHHNKIVEALRTSFGSLSHELRVVDFIGGAISFAAQAKLFRSAAAVIGPHGAAFSNLIFCQPGTRVVEYIQVPHFPLYMGYANIFDLPYWPVLDTSWTATVQLKKGAKLIYPNGSNGSDGLPYSNSAAVGSYAGISAPTVTRVVGCALSAAPSLLPKRYGLDAMWGLEQCGEEQRLLLNSEHLLLQSQSREGWTSPFRSQEDMQSTQPW